ncbi:MAG: STAS domain-containing protein [Chitinispirillales bacterium]|jgi:anti-anti-sigma factor|nr:STAS domain-containing protein [Chitinispirillales bacterium]
MALDVVVKSEDTDPVVELIGKIVDVDVKKFQHKLDHLYKKKDLPRIVLDVTRADFVDSHGLGVIVYFHTLMQKEKRKFVILNGNPDQNSYLNRLFELTNLDKVLNIVCTLDA